MVAVFGVTGWHMMTAYGLRMMGSGRAAIIAYTMPIWASLFSVIFLKERLRPRLLAGLVLGMAGMVVLLTPDIAAVRQAPTGALLILGAAIAWGAGTVGTKAFDWGIGTKALSGWQFLIGGLPILLVRPFMEPWPDLSQLSPAALGALVYTVLVGLVFCYTSYLFLVRRLPATVAAISILAIPVVGLTSSALLLGEPAGWPELVALLLVLSALALVLLPRRGA